MVRKQFADKAVLEKCVPNQISRTVEKVELVYGKLLKINNEILPMDYGQGIYVDEPEIARGEERKNVKRTKEIYEIERDRKEALMQQDIKDKMERE